MENDYTFQNKANQRGHGSIIYNELEKDAEAERLRKTRERLEAYKPELPPRTCSGLAEAKLEEIGENMLQIYKQVTALIDASRMMLDAMGTGLKQADESAAKYCPND